MVVPLLWWISDESSRPGATPVSTETEEQASMIFNNSFSGDDGLLSASVADMTLSLGNWSVRPPLALRRHQALAVGPVDAGAMKLCQDGKHIRCANGLQADGSPEAAGGAKYGSWEEVRPGRPAAQDRAPERTTRCAEASGVQCVGKKGVRSWTV